MQEENEIFLKADKFSRIRYGFLCRMDERKGQNRPPKKTRLAKFRLLRHNTGMKTYPYKLIAFDLDGTLLRDDKSIPEENLRALAAAAGRGIELVPATGRIFRGIPEAVKDLPFVRYYILSNGAAVYDSREDRTLYRGDVPLETALLC